MIYASCSLRVVCSFTSMAMRAERSIEISIKSKRISLHEIKHNREWLLTVAEFFFAFSFLHNLFSPTMQIPCSVLFFLFGDKLVLPTNRETFASSVLKCQKAEHGESWITRKSFSLDWILNLSQGEVEKVPRVHHHTSIRWKTQHIKRKEVNKQKYTQSVCERHREKRRARFREKSTEWI